MSQISFSGEEKQTLRDAGFTVSSIGISCGKEDYERWVEKIDNNYAPYELYYYSRMYDTEGDSYTGLNRRSFRTLEELILGAKIIY